MEVTHAVSGAPDVSVIICARNAADTITEQLDAVLAQEIPGRFEVIVVDNNSTDSTRGHVERYACRDRRVRVVDEPVQGLNRARNTGIRHARSDLLAFCDADDIVERGWLHALTAAHEPDAYVGGGLRRGGPNSPTVRQRWGVQEQSLDVSRLRFDGHDTAAGGNCCFHRALWANVGAFDENLSGAADETEFFARAGRAGYRYVAAPDAVVGYRMPATSVAVFRRGRHRGQHGETVKLRHGIGTAPLELAKHAAWLSTRVPMVVIGREAQYAWLHSFATCLGRAEALISHYFRPGKPKSSSEKC